MCIEGWMLVGTQTCEAFSKGWDYSAIDSGLREVPTDISPLAHHIEITGNHINHIPARIFNNLSLCIQLYLSENEISDISIGAFAGLHQLQGLFLNNNKIRNISKGHFSDLEKLQELYLGSNFLTVFPRDVFYNLWSLKTLYASKNKLSEIQSGTFRNLHNLTSLGLNGNRLKEITGDMLEGLYSLQELDLSSNKLSFIEDNSFQNVTKLKNLSLSFNHLSEIRPGMWRGLHSLENLDISTNRIHQLNGSCFQDQKSLKVLDLSNNKITIIKGVTDLKEANDNSIWRGLLSLQELHLQLNKISSVETLGFAGLPKLHELLLYWNKLETLSENVFDAADFPNSGGHPPKLTFSISRNPLQCDERLCWLKKAAMDGWITWYTQTFFVYFAEDDVYKPDCKNIRNKVFPSNNPPATGMASFVKPFNNLEKSSTIDVTNLRMRVADLEMNNPNDITLYGWDKRFCSNLSNSGNINILSL